MCHAPIIPHASDPTRLEQCHAPIIPHASDPTRLECATPRSSHTPRTSHHASDPTRHAQRIPRRHGLSTSSNIPPRVESHTPRIPRVRHAARASSQEEEEEKKRRKKKQRIGVTGKFLLRVGFEHPTRQKSKSSRLANPTRRAHPTRRQIPRSGKRRKKFATSGIRTSHASKVKKLKARESHASSTSHAPANPPKRQKKKKFCYEWDSNIPRVKSQKAQGSRIPRVEHIPRAGKSPEAAKEEKILLRVGFEPTRPKPHELESCPLDHSGIVAVADYTMLREQYFE